MTLQEQIRANRWRTLWLLFLFALLVGVLGAVLGFAFQPVTARSSSGWSESSTGSSAGSRAGRIVAGATGAQPADREQYPRLFHVVENGRDRRRAADQPPPVYVSTIRRPNAFAAGRSPDKAYVAVTTGLLNLMDERELEGVIAHELSHIRNRDVRLMTLVAVLVGVVALVSDFLLRISFFGGGRRSERRHRSWRDALGLAALLIAPVAAV